MALFPLVPEAFNFAREEEKVLSLWDKINAFKRSIEQKKQQNASPYTFYDGPPFATGLPHYGHLVASSIKDVVARYWTMQGHYVERRFGWDTHGLPIEMETEKALGLSGPQAIRDFGVDKFNEACRAGVLRYTKEWRRVIGRLGRWVDFDNDYKTLDTSFMESVWWAFSELWKKDLIIKGFRVMPYSARLATPLSNFEANLNYQDVQDPAVTVKAKIVGEPHSYLLLWTTTPWTLPANLAIAVGKDVVYVRVKKEGDDNFYIVAKDLVATIFKDAYEIKEEFSGEKLIGLKYEPIYAHTDYEKGVKENLDKCFKVISAPHVTTDCGTGLVHMAPAYGQEDFEACKEAGLPLLDTLDEEGVFRGLVKNVEGLNFKEADKIILKTLKDEHKIFDHKTLVHSYPFCWRSNTPLIYRAMPVWLVDVPKLRERMSVHNASIHWVPEAVGHKRFANWLKDAQEWSISRNRFWGTPIPIWQCDKDDHSVSISSVHELEEKTGEKITDLHSHFIDHLTFPCDQCSGTMKRISEVFDCWFESGSMPVAQIHYPFENKEYFKQAFPADFIAEGLDQTRGWFYTLLVMSTALFDAPPFKNVVVNGMVLAADGAKMSKSKKNYPDPEHVINKYGSDALRTYLVGSPVVRGEPLQFNELGVKEIVRSVLLPLYNSWSFFVQYATIDEFDPKQDLKKAPAVCDRAEIDRWILSKLTSLVANIHTEMGGYYLYKIIPPMLSFIDDLTNWYIRRSRRRFWKDAKTLEEQQDKRAAYATLYEVLATFSKVIAPLMPFMSETLYQNLVVSVGMHKEDEDSVHLCSFPIADLRMIDESLEKSVEIMRRTVVMGRALREKHRLKTRQPLKKITIVTHDKDARDALMTHKELITSELNIKEIEVVERDDSLCTISARPNFKTLGPRVGKDMGAISLSIQNFRRGELTDLEMGKNININGHFITHEDVVITRQALKDVVLMSDESLTVALDTELDQELIDEGLMREALSLLQRFRKSQGLLVTDRIKLSLFVGPELARALRRHEDYIKSELLATSLHISEEEHSDAIPLEFEQQRISALLG